MFSTEYGELIEWIGEVIALLGVSIIVFGAVLSTVYFVRNARRLPDFNEAYTIYRRQLGRGLLLGLEVLVAADIIETVSLDPSLESAASLGIIVLIRTFLSFTLDLEIDGKWPWQRGDDQSQASSTG